MLVVACNTASAVSLNAVKKEFPLPIIGVLGPGARAAASATKTGTVGVIGTEATIGSGAYEQAIKKIDPAITVHSLPCPLFVPLAEEGWTDNDVAALVAEKYLARLRGSGIDTLVLGCTHYPLLKGVINKAMGNGITLIDSAFETAKEVAEVLDKLRWEPPRRRSGHAKVFCYRFSVAVRKSREAVPQGREPDRGAGEGRRGLMRRGPRISNC